MSASRLPSTPPPAPTPLRVSAASGVEAAEAVRERDESTDEASGTRRRRRLSVIGGRPEPSLARHPRDGWRRARLFPMGRGARRALKGVIRAFCPTSGDAPQGPAIEHHIEVYVRFWMSYMPRWMARGIWLALFVLEWSPFWVGQGLRRLSALSPRRRARVIARLARSRVFFVRRLIFVVNSLFMSAYYDNERVHRALRYAPVPFIRGRIALRQKVLAQTS